MSMTIRSMPVYQVGKVLGRGDDPEAMPLSL